MGMGSVLGLVLAELSEERVGSEERREWEWEERRDDDLCTAQTGHGLTNEIRRENAPTTERSRARVRALRGSFPSLSSPSWYLFHSSCRFLHRFLDPRSSILDSLRPILDLALIGLVTTSFVVSD